MDRRNVRIVFILMLAALTVGVLPVIPVGEVLAPEHSTATVAASLQPLPAAAVSPLADASTLEKLRHLFSH
jgi:hypothetical protein